MNRLGPQELLELFHAAVPEGAEEREMGGSPAALVNGNVFMRLRRSQFVLRLKESDRKQLLDEPGATVFEAVPGRPMPEYIVVPHDVLERSFELDVWVKRSFDYASQLTAQQQSGVPKAQPRKQAAKTIQMKRFED